VPASPWLPLGPLFFFEYLLNNGGRFASLFPNVGGQLFELLLLFSR
jgi:hypothetical protein